MEKKYNILIADDEKEIISLLRLFLEKENINVYEAYDGEMAYMIIQNYKIDLAILDIMMPRMNGYEVIKKIRRDYDIPIMIISAKIELNDKIYGLELGADVILSIMVDKFNSYQADGYATIAKAA